MAKWGSVRAYVEEKFDEISEQIEGSTKSEVFRLHANSSGYDFEALRGAYFRLEKRYFNSLAPTAKSHGNAALTLQQEALMVEFLRKKTDLGREARIQGIQEFSATIRGSPLCYKSAKKLAEKYEYILEGTDSLSLLCTTKATEEEKSLKMLERKRKRVEKAQERAEKKKKQEAVTCKTEGCPSVWHNRTEFDEMWIWCNYCDEFGFCWKCEDLISSIKSMKDHEDVCKTKSVSQEPLAEV